MRKMAVLMLVGLMSVAATATVIDDFSVGLSGYTNTVILDVNGGGSNVSAWQVTDGQLEYNTTYYDGIEQIAFIMNGLVLDVGEEIQVDVVRNGITLDLGLYVGGSAPVAGVRDSYINVYARKINEVLSRGFTDVVGGEMNLKGGIISQPTYDRIFIKRNAVHDYEAGYYNGEVRVMIADRNGLTDIDGSYVGLYCDARATGILGTLDNLAVISEPSNPSVVQTQDGDNVDALLQWNAATDPRGEFSGLNVDPEIVNQYIFVSSAEDPNFYYKGAAGNPNDIAESSFDLQDTIQNDSSYQWVIVEAMSGFEQTLTANVSTLDDVAAENTVGPVWSFDSLVSIPVITQQPVNTRAFETDASLSLVCEFASVNAASASWYKSGNSVPLTTSGDVVVNTTNDGNGNYVSALEILTPALSDEAEYYCTIVNGTVPVTSDYASLFIKKLLAQYDFDGTLSPAVNSVVDAPVGQGKSVQGIDPNTLLAVDVALTYVDGIDGAASQAVQFESGQYIDFGVEGYPKAYPAFTSGYGAGLDEGTVVFWIKPNIDAFQVILGNFNDSAGTGFLSSIQADGDFDLLVRSSGVYLANHVAGQTNRPEYDLTDGWHMMAACWSNTDSVIYVDGQPVASNTSAIPASFDAWQYGMLLGAARSSANRLLLTDMFAGGAVDNLRIYNYRLDTDDNAAFAQEYLDTSGLIPCLDANFAGNEFNFDNTGTSYCTVDLVDFAIFASSWLENGLYIEP